jgi:hypothetical protein
VPQPQPTHQKCVAYLDAALMGVSDLEAAIWVAGMVLLVFLIAIDDRAW